MKFERGNDPKKGLRIGEYSKPVKVIDVYHEINGGMITTLTLPPSQGEEFMESLSEGIRPIPSGLLLPNGEFRERYSLVVEHPDGEHGYYYPEGGWVAEYAPTGRLFKIPAKLEEKIITYEI